MPIKKIARGSSDQADFVSQVTASGSPYEEWNVYFGGNSPGYFTEAQPDYPPGARAASANGWGVSPSGYVGVPAYATAGIYTARYKSNTVTSTGQYGEPQYTTKNYTFEVICMTSDFTYTSVKQSNGNCLITLSSPIHTGGSGQYIDKYFVNNVELTGLTFTINNGGFANVKLDSYTIYDDILDCHTIVEKTVSCEITGDTEGSTTSEYIDTYPSCIKIVSAGKSEIIGQYQRSDAASFGEYTWVYVNSDTSEETILRRVSEGYNNGGHGWEIIGGPVVLYSNYSASSSIPTSNWQVEPEGISPAPVIELNCNTSPPTEIDPNVGPFSGCIEATPEQLSLWGYTVVAGPFDSQTQCISGCGKSWYCITKPNENASINVYGNSYSWLNTGIIVDSTDILNISAMGTIFFNNVEGFSVDASTSGFGVNNGAPATNVASNTLVMCFRPVGVTPTQINDGIYVGSGGEFVNNTGQLWMVFNDHYAPDNSGSFAVVINKSSPVSSCFYGLESEAIDLEYTIVGGPFINETQCSNDCGADEVCIPCISNKPTSPNINSNLTTNTLNLRAPILPPELNHWQFQIYNYDLNDWVIAKDYLAGTQQFWIELAFGTLYKARWVGVCK